MTRFAKTVTVFEGTQWDGHFPDSDSTLPQVIAWLLAKLEQIPAEYQDCSQCSFGGEDYYGSPKATLKISYIRPETDDEIRVRETEARARSLLSQADERRQYERLKEKFGGDER